MRLAGYLFGGFLVLFGFVFCAAAAASGIWPRWILGGILLGAGLAVFYVLRMKVPATQVTLTQKIDLSGDVQLEHLTCKSCGATLDSKSVTVAAGAVFVKCPSCGSQYQIEEAPKW
jgi:predicted RNA-binding Zn-ribbon protein involved in translation (DUF1610 family)